MGNKHCVILAEDLYQTQMFTAGVIQALQKIGFKITKDNK